MQKKEEEESPVSHKLAKQIAENQKSISTYLKSGKSSRNTSRFRSRSKTRKPLKSIENEYATGANRTELGSKRDKQKEQESDIMQVKN